MSSLVHSTLLRAHKYAKNGDFDAAEVCYKSILSKFPKNKRAIQAYRDFKLGGNSKTPSGSELPQEVIKALIALYNGGQFEAALVQIQTLMPLFPKAIILLNLQGAVYISLNKPDAAIDVYIKVLAIKPHHLDANNNLGHAYHMKGDLVSARESYKKVISINSNHFEAHYNLGLVLHKVGDLNSAIVSYQKAVEIKPNYFEAYNNMGNVFEDRGDIKLAIHAYQKALTIKPDSFQACQNILKRPTGFLKVKTLDMIQNSLLKFSNHNEHSKNIGFLKANLLRHKGDTAGAFELFCEANKIKAKSLEQARDLDVRFRDNLLQQLQCWNPQKKLGLVDGIKTIFILGASKSGKSSLEKVLGQSPKVQSFYECLRPDSQIYSNPKKPDQPVNSALRRDNLSISDLFYGNENLLTSDGIEVVTCSNPFAIHSIITLAETLPNASFVFMSRNPMDVAADIFTTEYNASNYYAYDPYSIMEYINWYQDFWDILKEKIPESTLTINFECLMKTPHKIAEQLEVFLSTDIELTRHAQKGDKFTGQSEFRNYFLDLLNFDNNQVA